MATPKPSDFNKRVAFGLTESVKNTNTGSIRKQFVEKLKLWYAPKTRTLNQQYQLQGTSLENTKVIIVRHNPELEAYTLAKIGDVQYDIASISPDETNKAVAYDYVTLKRSE